MLIKRIELRNFGSYKYIEKTFTKGGVTLITGATGSGKSTFCDAAPWLIYGKTAKNGAVDDIINWTTQEPASGLIELQTSKDVSVVICRVRGPKSNDLYYTVGDGPATRGRDLADTQNQINDIIGLSLDSYLTAGYYHETCLTSTFFTAPAKIRRQLVEQIVDLSLIRSISDRTTQYLKDIKDETEIFKQSLSQLRGQCQTSNKYLLSLQAAKKNWEADAKSQLSRLREKSDKFNEIKQAALEEAISELNTAKVSLRQEIEEAGGAIRDLVYFETKAKELENKKSSLATNTCNVCNAPTSLDQVRAVERAINLNKAEMEANERQKVTHTLLQSRLASLDKVEHHYNKSIRKARSLENTYLEQLAGLQSRINPNISMLAQVTLEIENLTAEIEAKQSQIDANNKEISTAKLLLDLLVAFREHSSMKTVRRLQDSTNKILADCFDSEFVVQFDLEAGDKVEVTVFREGVRCVYSQLSKGQRNLLKLCFSVATMRQLEEYNGVHLNALFFDEALDGMDFELKTRALKLFDQLALVHDTVFVVQHAEELKPMVSNHLAVTYDSNGSSFEKSK